MPARGGTRRFCASGSTARGRCWNTTASMDARREFAVSQGRPRGAARASFAGAEICLKVSETGKNREHPMQRTRWMLLALAFAAATMSGPAEAQKRGGTLVQLTVPE